MFNFIKEMWWFVKKNLYFYIPIFFLGVIQALICLVPAYIIGDFTAQVTAQTLTRQYMIWKIGVLSVATAIGIYLITTTKRVIQNRLKVKLFYALQVRYMENIIIQDATFFENFQSGDLLTRALGDVKSVNFSGGNRLLNISFEVTVIIVNVIAMIMINPILTLVSVLPLSLIFVTNIILKVKVKRNWKEVRDAASQMGNVVLESITNVRTIRAFSEEENNYHKNLVESKNVYDIERKNLKINVVFQPIFQSITAVSLMISYAVAANMLIKGSVQGFSVALFIQFIVYLNNLASPLTNIGNMLTNFYQSIISLERLNEIYNSKSVIIDIPNAKELDEVKKVEFKDVSFTYPHDKEPVLNHINLILKEGQTLGIVGKTGSGKSTLVRQLMRQFPITDGKILINDIDIRDYKKESVRSRIGYVPQEHMLFSRSVFKNVRLGNSAHEVDTEDVYKAIDMADFRKDIVNLPEGLDTIVGEYGVTLSGGQKQRLSIARAFMKNADIMILDDSLSAVDGKTEANIIKNLNEYRSGRTNIIVAHRLSAVMQADNIIVLDGGRIIEEGTHNELMDLHGFYHDLFLEQQMTKDGE